MLKKLKLFCVCILASTAAFAALPDPLLVLDARDTDAIPKRFRMDTDIHAVGSAQFSERGLLKALSRIKSSKITIVDLREESHGFLNGNAISWYGKHDAANAGLSAQEIGEREAGLLTALGKNKFVKIYNIIKKTNNGTITEAKSQEYAVHSASSEEQIATKHHLQYERIYVQDFHAPKNDRVDQFVELVKKLPQDQWLYFHCRAGSGRTTTFLVMYDMMRNAKSTSFEAIMSRQHKLGGKDLAQLPGEDEFKFTSASDRLDFLKKFYQYAKDSDVEFSVSWSEWLKDNS